MGTQERERKLQEATVLNRELRRFGTSVVQLRSLTENFDPGKMQQFNHHIEFLSPNGKWLMRLTRVGNVSIEKAQIELEMPTGEFHVVEKGGREEEIIREHKIVSGDIVCEVYPFDPATPIYWYQSITLNPEHKGKYRPLEKFYNLTTMFGLKPQIYH